MTVIYNLYIISKSGGVIYHKALHKDARLLSGNDYLRLGSTFHSLYAITSQLSPINQKGSGLETVQTDTFKLQAFQTPTGVKFLILADVNSSTSSLESILKTIYQDYTDYVLKNPFYELEQPIRCDLFDQQLDKLVSQ